MRKRRPRPWWYHLISNAVPIAWLLVFSGLVLALFQLVVYLLTGWLLWF